MSDRTRRDDSDDIPVTPGMTGAGGQPITRSEDSLFAPVADTEPDERGVNEEDITMDDAELMDSGGSPEFDHSLRKRNSGS